MIIFAVLTGVVIVLLLYFFVFAAKKKAEGKDLGADMGEHP